MSSNNENHDLSPYEIARLERIQRNEDRLRSLGLIGNPALKPPKVTPPKAERGPRKKKHEPSVPTRSSKRLKLLKDGMKQDDIDVKDSSDSGGEDVTIAPEEEEEEEIEVNYDVMPKEPEQLDDDEFQVYVSLRAWRLRRKNELEVEPYKICQNRTLCELIRKKRNDAGFVSQTCEGNEESIKTRVEEELLSVWGIGPSKATEGGFGWEMLGILDLEENAAHLKVSRKRK